MNKNTLNFLALIFFLILISIPIYTSSLLDLIQQQNNEALPQKLLAEKLTLQETKIKKQKDTGEKIYLLGKFNPAQEKNFTVVPKGYSVSGYTMYLRKETLDAFFNMEEAADKDGVELKIASATRNFDYQKNLWNTKWNNLAPLDDFQRFQKILEYSAAPGTSRHHWGTDIDINAATPEYFDTDEGKEVYDWLTKNASLYGFCQPYTFKDATRPTGYNEEKWHWSYLPLSKTFTEEYKSLITSADLKGFDGDKYVPDLDLIKDYVLGINPECL